MQRAPAPPQATCRYPSPLYIRRRVKVSARGEGAVLERAVGKSLLNALSKILDSPLNIFLIFSKILRFLLRAPVVPCGELTTFLLGVLFSPQPKRKGPAKDPAEYSTWVFYMTSEIITAEFELITQCLTGRDKKKERKKKRSRKKSRHCSAHNGAQPSITTPPISSTDAWAAGLTSFVSHHPQLEPKNIDG